MEIKVLGRGCANCKKLELITREVIQEMGIKAEIEKVTDINEIAKAGVLITPGLMIDGEVKVSGRVPSKGEITKIVASATVK